MRLLKYCLFLLYISEAAFADWKTDSFAALTKLEAELKWLKDGNLASFTNDQVDTLRQKLDNFHDAIYGIVIIDYEHYDEKKKKFYKLSKEYREKFRSDDIVHYYFTQLAPNPHHDKQPGELELHEKLASGGMPQIIGTLISAFRADLNTYTIEHELLTMEEELEKYTARGDKLASAEAWKRMVSELAKIRENGIKVDGMDEIIGKLVKKYQQRKVYMEYQKNVDVMTGMVVEKIAKIRKEISENGPNVYLTERPFEKAENTLMQIKNDHEQMIEMSVLKKVMNLLIVESKLEILQNEFAQKFGKLSFKDQSGHEYYDWNAFVALNKAFRIGLEEINNLITKLAVKDQTPIKERINQIKKEAPIKAEPIKHIFIDHLNGMDTEFEPELEELASDLLKSGEPFAGVLSDQELKTMKQFCDRAIKLSAKLDKFSAHISDRYMPREIGAKLNHQMTAYLKVGQFQMVRSNGLVNLDENSAFYLRLQARCCFRQIVEMARKMVKMKSDVMNAFKNEEGENESDSELSAQMLRNLSRTFKKAYATTSALC